MLKPGLLYNNAAIVAGSKSDGGIAGGGIFLLTVLLPTGRPRGLDVIPGIVTGLDTVAVVIGIVVDGMQTAVMVVSIKFCTIEAG